MNLPLVFQAGVRDDIDEAYTWNDAYAILADVPVMPGSSEASADVCKK
jgi:hypothetical protein